MTKHQERHKKSEEFANRLAESGMNTLAYKQSPVSRGTTLIRLPRDRSVVKTWVGNLDADISVKANKRHRQAVISIAEPERNIKVNNKQSSWANRDENIDDIVAEIVRRSRAMGAPMWVPGAQWSVKAAKNTKEKIENLKTILKNRKEKFIEIRTSVVWESKVPATTLNALVGIDETAHFVAALPEAVSSVTEAHELLMPNRVRNARYYYRQGEFFFIPPTMRAMRSLRNFEKIGLISRGTLKRPMLLEPRSSHGAEYRCEIDEKMYVKGFVKDGINYSLLNWSAHLISVNSSAPSWAPVSTHEPFVLDDWHEVVRNNEIRLPAHMRQQINWD